jgi:ketosteroid isomerase-like protein
MGQGHRAKDLAQATSYYADTAEMFAPNAPAANGKDAVHKLCAGMLGLPGFVLTFAPVKVEVSRSGDLAYETGEYEMTLSDKKGKPQTVKAKYVVVWGKQPGGNWKALVDAPSTTTP